MNCRSSMIAVKKPTSSSNFVFRTACTICREGGNLAFAAFHEYPLPASMLNLYPLACSFTSSPLLCEMRIEELLARTLSVLFDSRCE